MKRYILPVLILIIFSMLTFGCTKAAIENAVQDFEDAVNEDDFNALDDVISDDSQMRDIGETGIYGLLDYFDDFRRVKYRNLDIEVDGSNADVNANATYIGFDQNILFKMKRDEAFFAFLFPDWKVKEYWDNNNEKEELTMIWQKIKEKLMLKQSD